MAKKTINLEKLIFDYKLIEKSDDKGELFHLIRYAMKEACKQTLELAAENAKIEKVQIDYKKFVNVVSKQSILETINQIG